MRWSTRFFATHLFILIILVVVMLVAIQLRQQVLNQFATGVMQM